MNAERTADRTCLTAYGCGLLLCLGLLPICLSSRPTPPSRPPASVCDANLRRLGDALMAYAANQPDGTFPEHGFSQLLPDARLTAAPCAFRCSADPRPLLPEFPGSVDDADGTSYAYLGAGLKPTSPPEQRMPLVFCDHHEYGVKVLFTDGRVERLSTEDWYGFLHTHGLRPCLRVTIERKETAK